MAACVGTIALTKRFWRRLTAVDAKTSAAAAIDFLYTDTCAEHFVNICCSMAGWLLCWTVCRLLRFRRCDFNVLFALLEQALRLALHSTFLRYAFAYAAVTVLPDEMMSTLLWFLAFGAAVFERHGARIDLEQCGVCVCGKTYNCSASLAQHLRGRFHTRWMHSKQSEEVGD